MKETTSELNLTLIAVMAVGVLVAFFYFAVWPKVNNNFQANSSCSKAICENPCGKGSGKNACNNAIGQTVKCTVPDTNVVVQCPWKG